jgi:hypothetical protein
MKEADKELVEELVRTARSFRADGKNRTASLLVRAAKSIVGLSIKSSTYRFKSAAGNKPTGLKKCAVCGFAEDTAVHRPGYGKPPGSKPWGHEFVLFKAR